jgi:hypothetical protein
VADKVLYKEFYITVRVELERDNKNRFQVVGQIRPVEDETQIVNTWVAIKEFASEGEAYEFGLQHCRTWIDGSRDPRR